MGCWLFSSLFNISSTKLHPNYAKHIDTHRADTETKDDYNGGIDDCDEDITTSSCSAIVDDEDIKMPNIS